MADDTRDEGETMFEIEDQVDTPREDDASSQRPPRKEVILGMKAKLLAMLPTLQDKSDKKKNGVIDPEKYFSEKYIASCFLNPRKPEFGEEPWLDDALYIFALSRGFDYESASRRFFKFNKGIYSCGLQSLDEIPEDVLRTNREASCFAMTEDLDALGRPVIYMTCTHWKWDNMSVLAAKRHQAWLFWQWSTMWGEASQTKGISFVMICKGFHMAQVKKEFEDWCQAIFMGCLPLKFAAMYLCYEPFVFRNIVWPLMSLGMKKKLKERVVWLGSNEEKVCPRYLEMAYRLPPAPLESAPGAEDSHGSAATTEPQNPLLLRVQAEVPVEMGGRYILDPDSTDAAFRARWKVSDEEVPEGCKPPPKKK